MDEKASRHDIHQFDRIISPLGNPYVIVPISILLFIIGVIASITKLDWHWFSRCGSLIAILGLLLTMSPTFTKGIYKSQAHAFNFAEEDEEGRSKVTSNEDQRIGISVFYGIILAVIGGIISAFGDLIGSI